MLTPMTSENRMNSCRLSSVLWPIGREEADRLRPFGLGRLDVAHEGVEVLDEGLHHLA